MVPAAWFLALVLWVPLAHAAPERLRELARALHRAKGE